MPFLAYDLSIDLACALRDPLAQLRKRSRTLARQLDDAADSVTLNLTEGSGRFGADRTQHYRIAYGSIREVRGALALAVAKGFIDASSPAHAVAARLGGMIYRLAR